MREINEEHSVRFSDRKLSPSRLMHGEISKKRRTGNRDGTPVIYRLTGERAGTEYSMYRFTADHYLPFVMPVSGET
jgi:hypothetical protein